MMDISFTGKSFRSAGDLFIQAVVNDRVVGCIVTSEALALCVSGRQDVSAEEIYRLHRALIERIASRLILAGMLAPVIVRGCDISTSRTPPPRAIRWPVM